MRYFRVERSPNSNYVAPDGYGYIVIKSDGHMYPYNFVFGVECFDEDSKITIIEDKDDLKLLIEAYNPWEQETNTAIFSILEEYTKEDFEKRLKVLINMKELIG